jgi:hypothetical protein
MSSTQQPSAPSASEPSQRAPAPSRSLFPLPDSLVSRMQEIAHVLADELGVAESRELKAMLQHEVAEVDERVRGDEPAAARGYLTAFNTRPSFRAPLDALIRLYTRRKSTANLTKLYETLVKAAPTPRDRGDALVLRGELYEDALGDAAQAKQSYESAVAVDPNHRVAWINLERMALRSGDATSALRALERLAELTRDPARRSRLLIELAAEQARVGTPGALEESARRLHEAAALPLGRWRALLELERFGEQHGRPEDVIFALESRAALAQEVAEGEAFQGGSGAFSVSRLLDAEQASVDAAELWTRTARMRFAALADAGGAEAAMERALNLRPSDARVQFAAMSLYDQMGEIEGAARHAAWLLAHDFGDASLRASLHFRQAESAALQGDIGAAASSLRAALAQDPGSAAARGALVEQTLAGGDGFEVVREFDELAESSPPGVGRAALHRASAALSLALRADVEGALSRFRKAGDEDPGDLVSRRASVMLLARAAATASSVEEAAGLHRARVAAMDALLPHAADDDERASLLIERFYALRYDLADLRGAAETAERLVAATGGARWAAESAATLWVAAGSPAAASRWAENLAEREDLGDDDAAQWRAAAARLAWAGGDELRARALAVVAHERTPGDDYAAALALSLSAASRDGAQVLEIARSRARAGEGEAGARWLVLAAALLSRLGDEERVREALDEASGLHPASALVRAAARSLTRWRGDAPLRAKLAEAALTEGAPNEEDLAGALELALLRAFVDHDVPTAAEVADRAAATPVGGGAPASLLLLALLRGARDGADAPGTAEALQALLSAIPSGDPLRGGVELEVARALSSSSSTREQGASARELVREEQPLLTAPRVLAMLDAVQREGRDDVPEALRRLAERSDPDGAAALRAAAAAALRAQGRPGEARTLALVDPEATNTTLLLSEFGASLDRAGEHARAIGRRLSLVDPAARPAWLRRAAHWSSLAGDSEEAIAHAQALLATAPGDLVALDVLRVSSRRAQRWDLVVSACERLAESLKAPARVAASREEAGVVCIESLGDGARAERNLRAALQVQPERPVAYARLREVLEGRRDTAGLEALVASRIPHVEDPAERAAMLWEQARLRRALGLREGALEAARKVVSLEPGHVAAWAMVAEVNAASGRLAETADALSSLAACADAPVSQRRVARTGAIELFAMRLNRPDRAAEQVEALIREAGGDDALVERGFALASAAERWDAALRFARLAEERALGDSARCGAMLRVAQVLRDRLRDSVAAREQALRAHDRYPLDLRALEVLTALADPDDRTRHTRRSIDALRESLRGGAEPRSLSLQVAEAARLGGDGVLQRAAERLASALGADFKAPRVSEPAGRASLRDPALVLRYRDAADSGRCVALLETLMPELAELAGLSTDALRVGRSERVKGAHPMRAALSQWLSLAGIGEFELYLGGPDGARVTVVPGDPPAVVVGRALTLPLEPSVRFDLLRQAVLLSRGLAAVGATSTSNAVGWALAAMLAADLPLVGGARGAEALQKPVAKAMSRRVRKSLAESARPLAATAGAAEELAAAVRAVRSTARRAAVAVTGAIPAAFQDVAAVHGEASPGSGAGLELSLFLLSDLAAQVMRETGVDAG